MKTLYSSTFISIILAFLMFNGYNGKTVDVEENPAVPYFTNIIVQDETSVYEAVQIEIFDDLVCDDCADFMKNTLPKIKDLEQETDNIEMRLYFIPDINDEINYMAAMSLKCAYDQSQYWEMHAKLHENKDSLNKKSFIQFGKELELNTDAMQDCMTDEVYKSSVEEDIKYASEKNITFKPTIFINDYLLIGNQPFENIHKIINKSLKEIQVKPIAKPASAAVDPVTEETLDSETADEQTGPAEIPDVSATENL